MCPSWTFSTHHTDHQHLPRMPRSYCNLISHLQSATYSPVYQYVTHITSHLIAYSFSGFSVVLISHTNLPRNAKVVFPIPNPYQIGYTLILRSDPTELPLTQIRAHRTTPDPGPFPTLARVLDPETASIASHITRNRPKDRPKMAISHEDALESILYPYGV